MVLPLSHGLISLGRRGAPEVRFVRIETNCLADTSGEQSVEPPQCQAAQESFQIWRLQPRGFHLTRIGEYRFPVCVKKICLRLGCVLVA